MINLQQLIMHPRPGGGLTYATTELDSMYGKICSAWTLENNCFDWQVTIPANTTATVYIPAKNISLVTESGQPLKDANGVNFLRMENDAVVLRVVSGTYSFSSNLR